MSVPSPPEDRVERSARTRRSLRELGDTRDQELLPARPRAATTTLPSQQKQLPSCSLPASSLRLVSFSDKYFPSTMRPSPEHPSSPVHRPVQPSPTQCDPLTQVEASTAEWLLHACDTGTFRRTITHHVHTTREQVNGNGSKAAYNKQSQLPLVAYMPSPQEAEERGSP